MKFVSSSNDRRLVPIRQQATASTDDDLVYWRIYASLDPDDITIWTHEAYPVDIHMVLLYFVLFWLYYQLLLTHIIHLLIFVKVASLTLYDCPVPVWKNLIVWIKFSGN